MERCTFDVSHFRSGRYIRRKAIDMNRYVQEIAIVLLLACVTGVGPGSREIQPP